MVLDISLVRWVLIILSVIMIFDRSSKFMKKELGQTLFKLILSILIWGVVLVISIYPTFAYYIAKKLGMGENLNTLIFFGFVIVFMLIFKIFSVVERIEMQITEIVRTVAIREGSKKNKKDLRL